MNYLNNINPLKYVRNLPIVDININDIIPKRNIKSNDDFTKKYIKFLDGKSNLYATRVKLKNIKKGFFKYKNGKFKYYCDKTNLKDVEKLQNMIRLGFRPELYIYKNYNKATKETYVCPDDVAVYKAYENLNIIHVPVLILDTPILDEESSLVLKNFKLKNQINNSYIKSMQINELDQVFTLIGKELPTAKVCFKTFNKKIKEIKKKLKIFHSDEKLELHYHHTLYYTILRIEEILKSCILLYKRKLYVEAISLTRSLYELMINFYLDWIAPNITHKYLELTMDVNIKEWKEFCTDIKQKNEKDGLEEIPAKELYDAQMFGFTLASKTSEKSKLFPCKNGYFDNIYTQLSKIIHQDYGLATRYRDTLEIGDEAIYNDDLKKRILRNLDLFLAQILYRIEGDIGHINNMN